MEVGHSEELEYVEASGKVVVYELKVVSIAKKSTGASAARAKNYAKTTQARYQARPAQAIGSASTVSAPSTR